MHRSGFARRAFQGAREAGRPVEALGNQAQPEGLDAVLALVVGDLARTWTKRRRMRAPSSRKMEIAERSHQLRAAHSHPAGRPADRGQANVARPSP